jgi:tRNA1(Val) A37 N6-methylase TrmN6
MAETIEITEDAALGGRLRLKQPRRGHRFGHDAILLAAATPAQPGDRVIELGAGVGAAALALLARVKDIDVTLVELDPALVTLANDNIAANGFAKQARAIVLDVASPNAFLQAGLAAANADHVLMNPPFNDPRHRAPADRLRKQAYAADDRTLEVWIAAAARLLRTGGILTLIWRADTATAVLTALADEFGGIDVVPVYPSADKPAIRVICRATKGKIRTGGTLPGLVLNDERNRPTPEAEAILREGKPLAPIGQS